MNDLSQSSVKPLALVTGSSRGLGFEIVKSFDQLGIPTLLTGRAPAAINHALKQLHLRTHRGFTVDFSSTKETGQFLEQLLDEQIMPTILVHNVGGKLEADDFPLQQGTLAATLQLNLMTAITINNTFLPFMLQQQAGRIIHISSDAALTGQASPAYVIAKSALNGYIKTAARFYAKHQIMLCGILPGILEHAGSDWAGKKFTQPKRYQDKLQQMPLGRFGQPHEVAGFVAELALSDSMMCAGSLFEFRGASN